MHRVGRPSWRIHQGPATPLTVALFVRDAVGLLAFLEPVIAELA